MIVYGSSMSPYVRKVLMFAAEKGIAVEARPVGLQSPDPEFREASPFGLMPGFRDGDFSLSDSSAIVTYLDAIRSEPALIPAAPRSRALAVWWDEIADTVITGVMRKMFFNRVVAPIFLKREGDLAEAERAEKEELPPLLDRLEARMPAGGFLVDDRLTLADVAVAQPFINFAHMGASVDPGRWPKLAGYLAAIHARPSVADIIAKEQGFFATLDK